MSLGTGEIFLSFLYFTMFFIWIWLLLIVFGDIFRSHDISGWVKAIWVIVIILLPYLGVFLYLIIRGRKMTEHAQEAAKAQDAAARQYIQSAVGPTSTATEIERLADLKAQGVLTDADFDQAKAKLLA